MLSAKHEMIPYIFIGLVGSAAGIFATLSYVAFLPEVARASILGAAVYSLMIPWCLGIIYISGYVAVDAFRDWVRGR